MTWKGDYDWLHQSVLNVTEGFRSFTGKSRFNLSFEFKKIFPEDLVLKQVREIYLPPTTPVSPVLPNIPFNFVILQNEGSSILANHRLKAVGTIIPETLILTPSVVSNATCLLSSIQLLIGGTNGVGYQVSGPLATLAGFSRSVEYLERGTYNDLSSWRRRDGTVFTLKIPLMPRQVTSPVSPLILLHGQELELSAVYPSPMFSLYEDVKSFVTTEKVKLIPAPVAKFNDSEELRVFTNRNVRVETRFIWPAPHLNSLVWTAPLKYFIQTTISNLTSEPLVLKSYFSQTYAPTHHNGFDKFLFEPGVDENVSPSQKAELLAKGITYLYGKSTGGNPSLIQFYSKNGDDIVN
jgi:hypothetical protein